MPDANGWPTAQECLKKIDLVAPDPLTADLVAETTAVLTAVIAEFQGPVGRRGTGGTGRRFTPITETRTYDGNGFARLRVDDIVPNTALTVTSYGSTLSDVVLVTNGHGLGYNVLARKEPTGAIGQATYLYPGQFPVGIQNIGVTATFGFAATVPNDVYEAVRGEVAYRALVAGVIGINGVGEQIQIGSFEMSTSVGAINWRLTSPISQFHDKYEAIKLSYRDSGEWRRGRLFQRMS